MFQTTPVKRQSFDRVTPILIKRKSTFFSNDNFCLPKTHDECFKIISTPEFQRLRRVSQLGICQYIFPSATHTRYEHSLGVSNLADRLIHEINMKQILQDEISECDRITEEDVKLICIAGLVHDLGHGPFSHTYEHLMKECGKRFVHEEQSCKLFRKIVDENQIDLDEYQIRIVSDIVCGEKLGVKQWRGEIISNGKNGIDVDRLDYIRRDSHHLNRPIAFDVDNIIKQCCLIDGKICFFKEAKVDIERFFTNRYDLYDNVYTNKNVTSAELLSLDIFREAYNYIPLLREDPNNLEKFIQLDDGFIGMIRFSTDENLKKAREMIRRLDRGDYYQYIGQIKQTPENEHVLHQLTSENLVGCGKNLTVDDVIVDTQYITVAKKNNWDGIYFVDNMESENITTQNPSCLYPTEDKTLFKRIYTRNNEKFDEVRDAFQAFEKNYLK